MLPRYLRLCLLVSTLLASVASAAETARLMLSGNDPSDAVLWDFYCTDGRKSREWTKIPVPSVWEQHGFGSYNYGGEINSNHDGPFANEQGLYRHTFTVPAEWRGRVIRIVFDASMTDTSVWINGQSAGATHQGGFYQFHYDITRLVRFGESNQLEVTVAKVSSNRFINLAERASDYWVFGGIYRPVWLEALPVEFIDWTAIDAKADGAFTAVVHLGQAADGAEIEAQVFDAQGRAVGSIMRATASGDVATVRGALDGIETWTAETPRLYHVKFTLRSKSGPVHEVTERFGFRTIEVRENDGVYINGQKVVLRGVNRHCFSPETGRAITREQSYADARLIKEMNMNAVRASHYPPDKHFLEACDELGLYMLDELAGWQKPYNVATGRRLIAQLVRRDVNHPSIVFWNNGNEGGWQAENDKEFTKWDPQGRTVLHPWAINGGINTDHYEKYESTVKLSAGPTIFMPTEFLHGLYDGGIGAGLEDYWAVMGNSPTVAGGFFWVFADEGIKRTDRDGAIDNAGNLAPDGIVGPHGEREGSFYTVKELWSPVPLKAPKNGVPPPAEWSGALTVENRYSFTDLAACTFEWKRLHIADHAGGETRVVDSGRVVGPGTPPAASATVQLPEAAWRKSTAPINGVEALHVTAHGPDGEALFTWSWPLSAAFEPARAATTTPPSVTEADGKLIVRVGGNVWQFDRSNGRLASVEVDGRAFALKDGPRLVAFQRSERVFNDVAPESRLARLEAKANAGRVLVEAVYEGGLQRVAWDIGADEAQLDYSYRFEGPVDILGVQFSYPEVEVRGKQWLGRGPFRVYKNRIPGGVLDVWNVAYNDPVPGRTYVSGPEFKGFFNQWFWLELQTGEGRLQIGNLSGVPYHALYRAKDGVSGLLEWPPLELALLDVIPAQRTKFAAPETLGPQGQTETVSGVRHGSVRLRIASE